MDYGVSEKCRFSSKNSFFAAPSQPSSKPKVFKKNSIKKPHQPLSDFFFLNFVKNIHHKPLEKIASISVVDKKCAYNFPKPIPYEPLIQCLIFEATGLVCDGTKSVHHLGTSRLVSQHWISGAYGMEDEKTGKNRYAHFMSTTVKVLGGV